MKNFFIPFALRNALGAGLYIAGVALFMSHTAQLFGGVEEKTAIIPFAMLLLFVLSATVTGSCILGQPILWYLDGKKKEAVSLFIATICCLFVMTVLAFTVLALLKP